MQPHNWFQNTIFVVVKMKIVACIQIRRAMPKKGKKKGGKKKGGGGKKASKPKKVIFFVGVVVWSSKFQMRTILINETRNMHKIHIFSDY